MKSYEEVYEIVKNELSVERFNHSVYVMERCVEFATIYGEDVEKAKLVGIAHDIAKEISKEDRVRIAEEHKVELDEFEKKNLSLIHAKLGAKICEEKFGFTKDMCEAIAVHTTAKPEMSKLDKILYIADFSEESRSFKEAKEAYEKAKENLDEAYYMVLTEKIKNMLDRKIEIHPVSIYAYNYFIKNENTKIL